MYEYEFLGRCERRARRLRAMAPRFDDAASRRRLQDAAEAYERVARYAAREGVDWNVSGPGYRLFSVGPEGEIVSTIEIGASDDREAIEAARPLLDGCDVEIWKLRRFVATLRKGGD